MKGTQLTNMADNAATLFDQGHYIESISAYNKVLEKIDKLLSKNKSAKEIATYMAIKADCYANMAMAHSSLGESETSLKIAKQAIQLIDENENTIEDKLKVKVLANVAMTENKDIDRLALYERMLKYDVEDYIKVQIYGSYANTSFLLTHDAEKSIDILMHGLALENLGDDKATLLSEIAYYYNRNGEHRKAESYALLAAKECKTKSQKVTLDRYLSLIYYELNDHEKSIIYDQKVLDEADTTDNFFQIYNNMIASLAQLERFDDAVKAYEKGKKYAQTDERKAKIELNIASVYFFMKEYELALAKDYAALELNIDDDLKATILSNMAILYANIRQTDNAVIAIEKAKKLTNDKYLVMRLLATTANIKADMDAFDAAHDNYKKALEIATEINSPLIYSIKASMVELHVKMYYEWLLNKPNNQLINQLRANNLEEIEALEQELKTQKILAKEQKQNIKNALNRLKKQLSMDDKMSIEQIVNLAKNKNLEVFLKDNGISIVSKSNIDDLKTWTILPTKALSEKGQKAEESANFSSALTVFNKMLEVYTEGIYWRYTDFCKSKFYSERKMTQYGSVIKDRRSIGEGKFGLADFCRKIAPLNEYGEMKVDENFIEFVKTLPFGQEKTDEEIENAVLELNAKINICRKARNHSTHGAIDTTTPDMIVPKEKNKISLSSFVTISNLILFQDDSIVKDINTMFGDFFEQNDNPVLDKKQKTLDDFVK